MGDIGVTAEPPLAIFWLCDVFRCLSAPAAPLVNPAFLCLKFVVIQAEMAGFCRSLLRSAGYRTMVRLVSPKVGRDADRGAAAAAGMLSHLCDSGLQPGRRLLADTLGEPVSLRAFYTEVK